ncbi:Serine/threonine-protein phosphatase 2A regulatory subunit B'' subunit gamma [Strongyloides ratti]|uniref:Serine/threonine-protein phosphatase 2A regulatory subunit B'' subunit gamma n=1 Tax=Strongyloides ratti TaxID=34506 RepID=A0A090MXW4_STRRB|nr:Serine/threonine-protein phosphatase 2A regulatory subunit B'' subunit gamma [Strongyloides ratti]CEF66139.1 Serine/threonine-protein phosphatase 2A regulatory subunit B'' subunit gamma [Strongyloides ratti]
MNGIIIDGSASSLQEVRKLSNSLLVSDKETVLELKKKCNEKFHSRYPSSSTTEGMVRRMFQLLDPFTDINEKMCKKNELKECLAIYPKESREYIIDSLTPAFFIYKDYENRSQTLRVPEIQYFLKKKYEKKALYTKLVMYDCGMTGYILKDDMKKYCRDVLSTYDGDYFTFQDESFLDECVDHAIMKIEFFDIDKSNNKYEIRKLLLSPRIDEFENVLQIPVGVSSNWYAPAKVVGFKNTFSSLDFEDKGYLTLEEFKRLDVNYSELFYERVYQIFTEGSGTFSLSNFKKLFLILENRHEYRAQKVFFKLLDVNEDGFICMDDISKWFTSLKKLFTMNTEEDFPDELDFVNQIFDFLLIPPFECQKISFDDIYKSRKGEQFYGMLINCLLYLTFENPEEPSEEAPSNA